MSETVEEWLTKNYKLTGLIAQGGMGTVYMAENRNARGKDCVIKQLRIEEGKSEEELKESQRLFKREADLLKDLKHNGIVTFFDDYISADGHYFLVMDHVKGNNLETLVQSLQRFSQDDVIKIGIQICEVLEYLHEHDPPIVYRDLKPSNLMLTPDGHIVFIYFGIARHLMPKVAATRVITAGYSPPEQYFGRPEFRSDLYALGATMSHLITGVRPRPLITSVPSDHNIDILPSLDALIIALTAHSPSDRPASARSVRYQLFKIYQEIHEDFEIPTEAFTHENLNRDDQFISQKIMQSGLKVAKSASKPLPRAKGPEQEYYTDEQMPSAIRRMVVGIQKLSSTKIPRYEGSPQTDTDETEEQGTDSSDTTGSTKTTAKPEKKQSFWKNLFRRDKED